MYSANINIKGALEDFSFKNTTFPYHDFVPRLYNFCRSLGFEPGKILPSRAFCSDENQGYPNLLLAPALFIALYNSEFSSFILLISLSQVALDMPRVILTIVMACLPIFIFIMNLLKAVKETGRALEYTDDSLKADREGYVL